MSQEKMIQIHRLEQALQIWEEMMWICGVKQKAYRAYKKRTSGIEEESVMFPTLASGPVAHYKEFRRHLLEMESLEDFDIARFQFEPHEGLDEGVSTGITFPSQLAAWTHCSRRVYHVDADLAAILSATSLKGLRVSDIHFPFKAFGISLEEPIIGIRGLLYDFILFAPAQMLIDGEVREFMSIRMYSTQLDQERMIPHETIDKMVARGRYEEAEEILRKKSMRLKQQDLDTLSMQAGAEDVLLTDIVEATSMPQTTQGYRILFGLMLYLRMLSDAQSRGNECIGEWKQQKQSKRVLMSLDRRAIADEALVCAVTSTRRLTPDERQALRHCASGKTSGTEMPWHFREGHWRRPPGKGNDPTWPKTVLVEPTVVRKDRRPEGAVAGGSLVHVR